MIEDATADTNVLIYSLDSSQGEKHTRALKLINALAANGAQIPLQALNEFYSACTRKRIIPAAEVTAYIELITQNMRIVSTSFADLDAAMDLHQQTGQQFFDALIISTASRSGCRTFFSEDRQHRQYFGRMQLIDPFALGESDFDALLP